MNKNQRFVNLAPTLDASRRTKNHVAHHGSRFLLLRQDFPQSLNGRESILVSSGNFLGWLPLDEIHIQEIDDGQPAA